MKKLSLLLIGLIIFVIYNIDAGFYFGMKGAVKNKVEKLDEEIKNNEENKEDEDIEILYEENFETYTSTTFTNGMGEWFIIEQYASVNYIDDIVFASGNKALCSTLIEEDSSINIAHKFSAKKNIIWVEIYLRGNNSNSNPVFALGNIDMWTTTVLVGLNMEGFSIAAKGGESSGGTFLPPVGVSGVTYNPGIWYKIKLKVDVSNGTFTIWVNNKNETKGTHEVTSINPNIIQLIGWSNSGSSKCWFDELKVWN